MYSRPVPPVNYIQPRWSAPVSFASLAIYRLYIETVPLLYPLIALLSLTLPTLTAAATTTATTLAACPVQQCVTSYSPHVDYYPIKDPSSEPDWTVLYFPSYKLVINHLVTGTETYLLYKCGTPRPVNASSTAGFNASTMVGLDSSLSGIVNSATKYFSSPVQTIGIDGGAGTVAVTYLELLGARTQLRYTDSFTITDITSPCVNVLIDSGNITSVTWNATTAGYVSLLIEGNAPSSYSNSISLAATADATVLARAGWVKLLGVMLDKEEAALGLYNRIQYDYMQLSEAVQPAVSPVAPVIAWVDWSSYPNSSWSITRSMYRESLVSDVGAVPYSGVNITTSFPDPTEFKAALVGVDVLIDETYYYTPTNNYSLVLSTLGFTAADVASGLYPFLSNSSVWRNDARVSFDSAGDDWYESAIAEPDAVLADFVRLVANFSTEPLSTPFTGTYIWFRNVALNESYYDVPLVCPTTTAPTLPLFTYGPVLDASSLPPFTCAAYLSDASLFGGGQSLAGCGVLQCVEGGQWVAGRHYFPVKDTSYAKEWSVLYFPSYKVVVNNLTTGVETYVLYMCGTPPPVNASSTAGFNASTMVGLDSSLSGIVNSATKYFSVPVQRVAVDGSLGSVGTTYLELLGERTSIAYLDTTDITSPCIEYLGLLEVIEPLPYYGAEYMYDEAVADLTLYGNTASDLPNGVSMAVTARVDDVTGYASWLKFVALFFNKEATASLLFNTTTANIASITAAATAAVPATASRKVVAWVSEYNDFSTGVPVYELEQSTYRDALVVAAGGKPLTVVAGGVSTGNVTAFKALLVGVDVLIDETYYYTPTNNYSLVLSTLGFTAADVASGLYPFLSNSSVWRNDAREGYDDADDWYESAVAEPDAVLADLLRLTVPTLHTPATSAPGGYIWFRNVAAGETVNVQADPYSCTDPSAPVIPLLQQLQSNGSGGTYGAYSCPAFLLDPTVAVPTGLQLYNVSGGSPAGASSSTGGAVSGSSSSTGGGAGGVSSTGGSGGSGSVTSSGSTGVSSGGSAGGVSSSSSVGSGGISSSSSSTAGTDVNGGQAITGGLGWLCVAATMAGVLAALGL